MKNRVFLRLSVCILALGLAGPAMARPITHAGAEVVVRPSKPGRDEHFLLGGKESGCWGSARREREVSQGAEIGPKKSFDADR